mgnify:CR=1 FL=1
MADATPKAEGIDCRGGSRSSRSSRSRWWCGCCRGVAEWGGFGTVTGLCVGGGFERSNWSPTQRFSGMLSASTATWCHLTRSRRRTACRNHPFSPCFSCRVVLRNFSQSSARTHTSYMLSDWRGIHTNGRSPRSSACDDGCSCRPKREISSFR